MLHARSRRISARSPESFRHNAPSGLELECSMTRPAMRTDLHPLCQRHHSPMTFGAVKILSLPSHMNPILLYVCEEPACSSRYNIEHGYFSLVLGEEIRRDAAASHRCTHDGFYMYISEYDPQKRVRTWRCAAEGCTGSRTEQHAAA
jgi:hypothetical protein